MKKGQIFLRIPTVCVSKLHLLMYFLGLHCSTWIVEKLKTPQGRYNRHVFFYFVFFIKLIHKLSWLYIILSLTLNIVTQNREDKYDFFSHTIWRRHCSVQRPAGQRTHRSYCYVFSYFVNGGGHCG